MENKIKTSPTLAADLQQTIKGDVAASPASRAAYSHDASLFELLPEVVAYPKDSEDVCRLVTYVNQNKKSNPNLSLTARSAGTDMSGGAINTSIIVAFEKYFTATSEIKDRQITVQPGVFYRDLEPKTLQQGLLLPSYPASRDLCMTGGMVANNSGGEKSLIYGKTDRYVRQLKMVLRDGKEYTFQPLKKPELQEKLKQKTLDGKLHKAIYDLVTTNQTLLDKEKPAVSKNSTAYNLWEVWDGETFDITKIITGSQGTLGLITEVTFDLVPAKPLSGMLVAFLPSLKNLGEVINSVLPLQPTSLESFDDHTILFAFRFFFSFRKTLGWKKFILLGLSFIPVLNKLLRFFPRLPKIVLMVEFEGDKQVEIDRKIDLTARRLTKLGLETQPAREKQHTEKFWTMRRESFNLLRKNIKNKHTAPFIDDLIVPPSALPDFLPRLTKIMERYKFMYTVAGHMGDGNFHIIPLMNLEVQSERDKIYPALQEVTKLVLEYKGSLSGEHNDGLIRGPMLGHMYSPELMMVFKKVKQLFDPDNIFNPHKKTDATLEFSKSNMRERF